MCLLHELQKISENAFFRENNVSFETIKTYIRRKRGILTSSIRLLGPDESDKINDEEPRKFKGWQITSTQKNLIDKEFKKK